MVRRDKKSYKKRNVLTSAWPRQDIQLPESISFSDLPWYVRFQASRVIGTFPGCPVAGQSSRWLNDDGFCWKCSLFSLSQSTPWAEAAAVRVHKCSLWSVFSLLLLLYCITTAAECTASAVLKPQRVGWDKASSHRETGVKEQLRASFQEANVHCCPESGNLQSWDMLLSIWNNCSGWCEFS